MCSCDWSSDVCSSDLKTCAKRLLKANGMLPKSGRVREATGRRLPQGTLFEKAAKRAKASNRRPCARRAAERRPTVRRRRKRMLEKTANAKGGRAWEGGESESWKKAVERRKLPREAQKRQCATGAATGSRVLEGCEQGECCRRRPCAEDCERGERRRKQPCATKAATSSRVPEDCGMRLLPKATVCERL